MSTPPSGEQFELRHADQVAVVVEVGATLRAYRAGGREAIDGFAADEAADGARGQPLIPWPNRIRDGRYQWRGSPQQLPLDEVANANAIHGLVRWRNWTVAERDASRVALALRLHPQPGYPFTLDLRVAYQLDGGGLRVRSVARNVGASACPYGVGFHPYLTLGGPIDGAQLTVPAARRLVCDERAIPVGAEAVDGTELDFREPRAIGATVLDTCFCELERERDGRARVRLADGDAQVALWMGEAFRYAMVFSGDALAPERRRRGLAVEPMSCAPNAFASGGRGLVTLEAGATHSAEWGIEVSPR